ncbi:MAG: hypothetical protein E7261_06060 [Lachnospiraceae bacterium]|nr:hypothetical protein [Lachnospiraceae bacterium]
MSLTEKFEKRAYPAFLAGLVLMAAAIQIKIYFGGTIDTRYLLLIVIAMMIGFFFVDYFSNRPGLYIAFGVTLVVGAFAIWRNFEVIKETFKTDINIRVLGMIFVVGILLYISQQFFVLRVIVCVGYWGAMLFLIYKNLFPVKTVMFALVGQLIMVITEVKDRLLFKEEEKRNKKMFFLFPLVLLFVIMIAQLPYKPEPFEWKGTKKVIKFVRETFEEVIDFVAHFGSDVSEFGVSFIGYSESGDITGDKVDFDGDALDLTMVGNEEHIYLVGNIKSDYVGNAWVGNPKNKEYAGIYEAYELDTAEFLYAMYRANVTEKNSIWYLKSRNLVVEYDGVYTASLFRPSNTIIITKDNHKGEILADKDNVTFSKNQNKDTKYSLWYFSVNRASDQMINAIRSQSGYSYNSLSTNDYNSFKREINSKNVAVMLPQTSDFEKELKERAEYIRNTYMNIPEIITDRTYKLAEEITQDCTTDYDKMVAIVDFLSDYVYTTTPGSIPKGKDVVEYFLFESKQGYCTYFATVAAILGRCVGIPTRYVQGYLLNVDRMGNYGSYSVKEDQAHVWIESYIEGVGWLTFEPTPGNFKFLYQRWDTPDYITYAEIFGDVIPDNEGIEVRPNLKPEVPTEPDMPENEFEDEPEEIPEEIPEETAPLPDNGDDLSEKKEGGIFPEVLKYTAITALLVIVVYFVYLKINERRFWSIYLKAPVKEKIRMDMKMVLWIMENAGYPIENEETLNNYVERMKKVYPDKAVVFTNVNDVYINLRYNERYEATMEERRMAQRLRLSFMDKSVKENAMAIQCLREIVNDSK